MALSFLQRWTVILLAGVLLPSAAHARAVISEVMWMGTDLSASDEWLELAAPIDSDCPEGGAQSLSGMLLTSLNSAGAEVQVVRFETGDAIACGAAVVLARSAAENSRLLEEPFRVLASLSLPNTALLLRLYGVDGTLVDQADDGVGTPFAGANPSGGVRASMERIDLSQPGGDKANWRSATVSTGFDAEASVLGTPGAVAIAASASSSPASSTPSSQGASSASSFSSMESSSEAAPSSASSDPSASSIPASSALSSSSAHSSEQIFYSSMSSEPLIEGKIENYDVRINEVLADPIGSDTEEWIELINLGPDAVDLEGWLLSVSGATTAYRLRPPTGSEMIINVGETLLLRKILTGISLENRGKTVRLMKENVLIDQLMYPSAIEGVSFGRLADAPDLTGPFCTPTPGLGNTIIAPEVRIILQSGTTQGEGSVTLNLDSEVTRGTASGGECFWQFQDGFTSSSCNPPSHTFRDPGSYAIELLFRDYCGNTVRQSLDVHVFPEPTKQSITKSSTSSSAAMPLTSIDPAPLVDPKLWQGTQLELAAALPNPPGADKGGEWVQLWNAGSSSVDLAGWFLQDGMNGKVWKLEGRADAASPLRLSMPPGWTLRNASGSLILFDPSATRRSQLLWHDAQEGVEYTALTRIEPGRPQQVVQVRVRRVLDGDTFEAVTADTPAAPSSSSRTILVRLRGIGAPELVHADEESPLGIEAKNLLSGLIDNKIVDLFFDIEVKDPYGRTLAYVRQGKKDIHRELLRQGLASITELHPTLMLAVYLEDQAHAKEEKKGIWAADGAQKNTDGDEIEFSSSYRAPQNLRVLISEVYPVPQAGEGEWVELYNPNDTAVSLAGWIIDDLRPGGSKEAVLPGGTWIEHKSYSIISLQELGLKLNDDGDEIHLIGADGFQVDAVSFGRMKKGESYARDGVGEGWCVLAVMTPGIQSKCLEEAGQKPFEMMEEPLPNAELFASGALQVSIGTLSGLSLYSQGTAEMRKQMTGEGSAESKGAILLIVTVFMVSFGSLWAYRSFI